MRGLHKSKRVSWASDVNLCQVKLFLKEEAPIQVGLDSQDDLQPKNSMSSHSIGHSSASDDNLPPGFDAPQQTNQLQINLSEIPLIQWRPPSRVLLDPTWRVVTGEESLEPKNQTQREMRVFEAIYPRQSSIPQDPLYSVTNQEDHSETPIIPITCIEDEDSASDHFPPNSVANDKSADRIPCVIQPDVAAATSTAFAAMMKGADPEIGIDQDLLVQILSNPKMIEKLVTDYGNPYPVIPPTTTSTPPNLAHPPPMMPLSSVQTALPPPPPPRDMGYFKHLINQHGGEGQRQQQQQQQQQHYSNGGVRMGPNPEFGKMRGDLKGKMMRPCMYFKSARGCRNGANCTFLHDNSLPQQSGSSSMTAPEGQQSSKRMKFDREISGT